jgi:3-dehydroquinate synthase
MLAYFATCDRTGQIPNFREANMKTLQIRGSAGSSNLIVGECLQHLANYLPGPQCVLITDPHVFDLYHKQFPPHPVITIGLGEENKTLETVHRIYERLVDLEADRSTFIVGIGGGIVCDVAGFAASTYMRGLRFGFVASTLLAQVDASVGGKNGVNFSGYKNMIGLFNQPEFVICDLDLLRTLPKAELLCGLAEIVKHAAIADAGLFAYLESHWRQVLGLEPEVIEKLVFDSVTIKADVVNRDEKESGLRRTLNFGHTLGHAIEKTTAHPHGEAVSIGMLAAAEISRRKGLLAQADLRRLEALLANLGLPTRLAGRREALLSALRKDKKRQGDQIHFVLLDGIGRTRVEALSLDEIDQLSTGLI